MKHHGLLMTPENVRATLAGIKTETRRIPSPHNCTFNGCAWPKELMQGHWKTQDTAWKTALDWQGATVDPGKSIYSPYSYLHVQWPERGTTHRIYPRIQPGDFIYVKEACRVDINGVIHYKADIRESQEHIWCSPLYMPREAARIVREVESVGFEFLQEIDEAGAVAEGINSKSGKPWPDHLWSDKAIILRFQDLWDSINAKRGYPWSLNPPVIVIKFKKENKA